MFNGIHPEQFGSICFPAWRCQLVQCHFRSELVVISPARARCLVMWRLG